jgi:hypothetical protein
MTVRRLAAVDLHGLSGTTRRRRIIVAEFTIGLLGMGALGSWLLSGGAGGQDRVFGYWVTGSGLNYLPLAVHAFALCRRAALDRELAGVDIPRELRRYGILQFWILVPLSLVVLDAHQRIRRDPPRG